MDKLSRRDFVRQAGAAAGLLGFASPFAGCNLQAGGHSGKGRTARPNVLFIFTDQQTLTAMSAYDNPLLKTPAMDSIAAEGVAFRRSYCTSPVCSPSRSSLTTSRMPHETAVNYNNRSLDGSIRNMGDIFRQAGYRTVWGGKWHLPESYPLRAKSKQHEIRGFELLKFYDSHKNWPQWGLGDITDEPLGDAAAEFISGYSDDRPFLLGVSFCNPHDICACPRKPQGYGQPDDIEVLPPLPANFDVDPNEPQMVQWKRQQHYYGDEITYTTAWDQKRWKWYIYNYYRMTERVDRAIGKVLDALKRKGLRENTLIIFTSDHGDGCAAHKWVAKLNLYQESATVPLVVSFKGVIPAGRLDAEHLVCGLDVLPTMCDYAAVKQLDSFRGRSIRPVIENPDAAWRDFVVTELATDPKNERYKGRMIRTDRYKYNLYSAGERNEQLFDLLNDPGETQNLAYEPSMQAVKQRHRKLLDDWMRQTNDDFELIAGASGTGA